MPVGSKCQLYLPYRKPPIKHYFNTLVINSILFMSALKFYSLTASCLCSVFQDWLH